MNISKMLTDWYSENKRDLPWRNTKDPYRIWLSEIILQQTRVNQGIDYYHKILNTFPDVYSLSKADLDQLLKLWQGLGYYSRARNMHAAAKMVVYDYNGKFPSSADEIKKLKGIGEYTAGAILSFAYDLPEPLVDGNVFRFLSRLYGIYTPIDSTNGKKEFTNKAKEILPKSNTSLHNQSIMEFGALQCTPKKPYCVKCIFKSICYANNLDAVSELPVKSKKTKTRIRYFHYLLIESNNQILLKKRTAKDIWQSLYELPLIETTQRTSTERLVKSDKWEDLLSSSNLEILSISKEYKHILSHQKIMAKFYHLYLDVIPVVLKKNFLIVDKERIENFAVPRLIEIFFEDHLIT